MNNTRASNVWAAGTALALAAALAGCGDGSTSDAATGSVAGDVPIAYALRVNTIGNGLRGYIVQRVSGDRWIEVRVIGAKLSVSQAVKVSMSVGVAAEN